MAHLSAAAVLTRTAQRQKSRLLNKRQPRTRTTDGRTRGKFVQDAAPLLNPSCADKLKIRSRYSQQSSLRATPPLLPPVVCGRPTRQGGDRISTHAQRRHIFPVVCRSFESHSVEKLRRGDQNRVLKSYSSLKSLTTVGRRSIDSPTHSYSKRTTHMRFSESVLQTFMHSKMADSGSEFGRHVRQRQQIAADPAMAEKRRGGRGQAAIKRLQRKTSQRTRRRWPLHRHAAHGPPPLLRTHAKR